MNIHASGGPKVNKFYSKSGNVTQLAWYPKNNSEYCLQAVI